MKILVLGGGGREHALAWKISQSPRKPDVICAPGNGGMARQFPCFDIAGGLSSPEGVEAALTLAKEQGVDFTVVGPEAPLALGIVDRFAAEGLHIFGPTRDAARLESSKCFAKDFLDRHEIPTAAFRVFTDAAEARKFVEKLRLPVVIKADGLAEGKGAFVCRDRNEAFAAVDMILVQKKFGEAGEKLIVEDFLKGEEITLLVLTDGEQYLTLETARDYKAARDGDQGQNTGGMGSYSPLWSLEDPKIAQIQETIVSPTINGLGKEGIRFKGLIYFGLMVTAEGPQVLEYNVRFGDPETQPLLMRLRTDLIDLLEAVAEGRLDGTTVEWDPRPSICVIAASGGYPGPYQTGFSIKGIEEAEGVGDGENLKVFGAGVRTGKPGPDGKPELVTSGGRVLGVTAVGQDLSEARDLAYRAMEAIQFDRMHYRKDIGL
jgi:phosphoribosylamine--glycine ligase